METLEFFNKEIQKAEESIKQSQDRLVVLKKLKAEFEKEQKKEQEVH